MTPRNARGGYDWLWKGGAICAGLVIMGLVLLGAFTGGDDGTSWEPASRESGPIRQSSAPPVERMLESRWRSVLSDSKQEIFEAFHPVGRATRIELHAVDVKWKNGIRTNRLEDIGGMGIRYSVFWEGPVTKDGYTKLYSVYDAELGRLVGSEVLATNGITNNDVAEGIGLAIGLGLSSAMESE
ncbi:MAG: hypothetical protein KF712_16055 [Akkermansiaceae bacterium]|nr:hypothetical protein [Akkermansiaceae bacterium]